MQSLGITAALAATVLGGAVAAQTSPPDAGRAAAKESPRQNKAAPPQAREESTRVSGVTVTLSRDPPHVVTTFPANGASVAPGVLVLRVTYSQSMFDESWSYVTSADGEYPECAPTPRLLDDKKSFALICRTSGKHNYALWLNRGPYANFMNKGRRIAVPYELKFSTSDADPVFTLKEAVAADPGLPPGSNPAEPVGKVRPGEVVADPDGG